MREPPGLLEGGLAVVLHPAVLAQEGAGEAQRQPELEREAVNAGRQEDWGATWTAEDNRYSRPGQSWALSVFFHSFNNKKMIFGIFHQVNLTGSGLFKWDWGRNRLLTFLKMQKIMFYC